MNYLKIAVNYTVPERSIEFRPKSGPKFGLASGGNRPISADSAWIRPDSPVPKFKQNKPNLACFSAFFNFRPNSPRIRPNSPRTRNRPKFFGILRPNSPRNRPEFWPNSPRNLETYSFFLNRFFLFLCLLNDFNWKFFNVKLY